MGQYDSAPAVWVEWRSLHVIGNQRLCKKVPKVYLLSAQAFYATFGIPISCMVRNTYRFKATALLDQVYYIDISQGGKFI